MGAKDTLLSSSDCIWGVIVKLDKFNTLLAFSHCSTWVEVLELTWSLALFLKLLSWSSKVLSACDVVEWTSVEWLLLVGEHNTGMYVVSATGSGWYPSGITRYSSMTKCLSITTLHFTQVIVTCICVKGMGCRAGTNGIFTCHNQNRRSHSPACQNIVSYKFIDSYISVHCFERWCRWSATTNMPKYSVQSPGLCLYNEPLNTLYSPLGFVCTINPKMLEVQSSRLCLYNQPQNHVWSF